MYNKEKARQWYQDNKEKRLAYAKEYAKTHREQRRASGKRYYWAHKGEQDRAGYLSDRAYRQKLKVLAHYGSGGALACVNCGFGDIRALTIDHIGGNGNKHRKKEGVGSGAGFYYWLIKNNYPEGYQTLCMNCQFIKKVEEHEHRWR